MGNVMSSVPISDDGFQKKINTSAIVRTIDDIANDFLNKFEKDGKPILSKEYQRFSNKEECLKDTIMISEDSAKRLPEFNINSNSESDSSNKTSLILLNTEILKKYDEPIEKKIQHCAKISNYYETVAQQFQLILNILNPAFISKNDTISLFEKHGTDEDKQLISNLIKSLKDNFKLEILSYYHLMISSFHIPQQDVSQETSIRIPINFCLFETKQKDIPGLNYLLENLNNNNLKKYSSQINELLDLLSNPIELSNSNNKDTPEFNEPDKIREIYLKKRIQEQLKSELPILDKSQFEYLHELNLANCKQFRFEITDLDETLLQEGLNIFRIISDDANNFYQYLVEQLDKLFTIEKVSGELEGHILVENNIDLELFDDQLKERLINEFIKIQKNLNVLITVFKSINDLNNGDHVKYSFLH